MANRVLRKIRQAAVISIFGAMACTAALAARNYTPQAGTWIVSSEIDGKPGRGLSIDVQGNTLFVQVFAYAPSGEATFYTATGELSGDRFVAPLLSYAGGRYFGSDARIAAEVGSAGDVEIVFQDGLRGVIKFPNEESVPIERFLLKDGGDRSLISTGKYTGSFQQQKWFALNDQGEPEVAWDVSMSIGNTLPEMKLDVVQVSWMVNQGRPIINLQCPSFGDDETFECTTNIDIWGGDNYNDVRIKKMRIHRAGADLHGEVWTYTRNAPQDITRKDMIGIVLSKHDSYQLPAKPVPPSGGAVTIGFPPSSSQFWTNHYRSRYGELDPDCSNTCKGQWRVPKSGTWVVADELNGKPGRGISLDIQHTLVIASIYNYLSDGSPTFHMASASMGPAQASLNLTRYKDGRYFGGSARSAAVADNTGPMSLRFELPGNEQASSTTFHGQVGFPDEDPVKIQRLVFDNPPSFAEKLMGSWWAKFYVTPETAIDQKYFYTRPDGEQPSTHAGTRFITLVPRSASMDSMVSTDGSVTCAPAAQNGAFALCQWKAKAGVSWAAIRLDDTVVQQSIDFIRIRDRFGNSVGLGPMAVEQAAD